MNIYGNDEDFFWRYDAACSEADTELFFPPRDKDLYKDIAAQAKQYCNGARYSSPCPVRGECLWYAISTDELHGIWGGMSHRERNAFVRKWQKEYKGKLTLKEYIFEIKGGDKWP